MKWPEHVVRIGNKRNIYNIAVGKHDKSLGRSKLGPEWENNIKIYIKETGCEDAR
jgi:hypothetical protein